MLFKSGVVLKWIYKALIDMEEEEVAERGRTFLVYGEDKQAEGFQKIDEIVNALEDPGVSYGQYLFYLNMFDKKEHPIVKVLHENGTIEKCESLRHRLGSWESHPKC